MSRRSGTLQLTTPAESGEIVFRAGKVVAAVRTNGKGSLGDALLEAGVIAATQYQDMLAAQKAGKRGQELFSAFKLDEAAMNAALEALLKRVIFAMFDWAEGTFSFVLEETPDVWRGFVLDGMRVVFEPGLNPQYLAIEGARLRDERTKEDSLESFLSRDKPTAQARLEQSAQSTSVKEIAARLREAADLPQKGGAAEAAAASAPERDDIMTGTFSEGPAPDGAPSEKVIPFPAERVRREAAPVPAPAPARPAPGAMPMPAAPKPIVPAPPGSAAGAEAAAGVAREAAFDARPAPAPAPAATPAPAPAPVAASAARLLAVDDDPQVTKHIRAALAARYGEVLVADTVQDALNIIGQSSGDLLVASDLIIARSDGRGILGGIEILERIREKWPQLPVVLFTDYQNEEAETKAKALGVAAVLTKPRKAQVQAAPKDGQSPLADFLKNLEGALEPHREAIQLSLQKAAAKAAPPPPVVAPAPGPAAAASADKPAAPRRPVIETPAAEKVSAATPAAEVGAQKTVDIGRELVGELGDLEQADEDLPPVVLSAGEMATLRSMLAELIDPANRDTITLLVLRFASNIVERAGLFLATRRAYVGLGGFSIDEPSDRFVARVRKIQIPVDHDSVFARVSRFRAMIRGELKQGEGNQRLVTGLGGKWPPDNTVAAPLISGDRVAAILYGDNPSGKPLGPTDGLEIFLQQAGLAMDRALLERKLEDTKKKQGGSD